MKIARTGWLLLAAAGIGASHAEVEFIGGDIHFTGRLVAQPCIVDPESQDFSVELGQSSIQTIQQNGGKGPAVPFSIQLHQCNSKVAKSVTVTFKGVEDSQLAGGLQTSGSASGIALRLLTGADETVIDVNQPAPESPLVAGDNSLNFKVRVETLPESPVEAGDFTASATFALSYQ